MKRPYAIVALILMSTAVVMAIHRTWSTERDSSLFAATHAKFHPQSAGNPGTTSTTTSTHRAHRDDSYSLRSWKVEAIDPSQSAEVEELRAFAMSRLELLDNELALNSMQRKRIFQLIMAYSAPEGLAFQIGGQTVHAPQISMEDAIHGELDAERGRIYQQSLIDHASWWANAVEQMELSLDEEDSSQVLDMNETP